MDTKPIGCFVIVIGLTVICLALAVGAFITHPAVLAVIK
jgi:hypothetical protein